MLRNRSERAAIVRALAAVGFISLVLATCGGDDDGGSASGSRRE